MRILQPVSSCFVVAAMASRILSTAVIVLCGVVWADAQSVCRAPGSAQEGRTAGIETPLQVANGALFVSTAINGHAGFSFQVDSGFDQSVLDTATVQALGISSVETHEEQGPGGLVKVAKIPHVRLTVGTLDLPPTDLTTTDLSNVARVVGHRIDGILGYDFLQRYVVILDYIGKQMTICDPTSFRDSPGATVLHADLKTKQPYVEASITTPDGVRVVAPFEVDTGSLDAFTLNAEFARAHQLFAHFKPLLAVRGVSIGGDTQAWIGRAESGSVGAIALARPIIGIAEENAERAGQLGAEVLRRFRITFDYTRSVVILEPNSHQDDPFEFDHTGMLLMSDGPDFRGLLAFLVIEGTPAANAGLKEGDKLRAIDGQPTAHMSLPQVRELLKRELGLHRLTVDRGSRRLTVVVTCHPLV